MFLSSPPATAFNPQMNSVGFGSRRHNSTFAGELIDSRNCQSSKPHRRRSRSSSLVAFRLRIAADIGGPGSGGAKNIVIPTSVVARLFLRRLRWGGDQETPTGAMLALASMFAFFMSTRRLWAVVLVLTECNLLMRISCGTGTLARGNRA